MTSELLFGAGLRNEILSLLREEDSPTILSAFFTWPALEWLEQNSSSRRIRLCVRCSLSDVLFGSCDLNAIEKGLKLGWDVRFDQSLHAKAFLAKGRLIVGSANLTANGMSLCNMGNFELCTLIEASDQSAEILHRYFEKAKPFTVDLLNEMRKIADEQQEPKDLKNKAWPQNLVATPAVALSCFDFPESDRDWISDSEREPWKTIAEKLNEDEHELAKSLIEETNVYRWLENLLAENGGRFHFGGVLSVLKNDVFDRPSPKGAPLKSLLSNLYSYIEATPDVSIYIQQPNISQIAILK